MSRQFCEVPECLGRAVVHVDFPNTKETAALCDYHAASAAQFVPVQFVPLKPIITGRAPLGDRRRYVRKPLELREAPGEHMAHPYQF